MATTQGVVLEAQAPAGSDISAHDYKAMKLSSGKLAICDAAGEYHEGALQNANDCNATNKMGRVAYGGSFLAQAGGTITRGQKVGTDGNGRYINTTTSGHFALGTADEDAVNLQIFRVNGKPHYIP